MAFSKASLVQRVRDITGENPWQTTATGTGTGAVNVVDGTRWDEGAILEWQDTGEQDWVQTIATNALTCIRGINGTTAVTHTGSVVVYRDPTFTYQRIVDSVENVMQTLWPYAWKKKTVTLTYDSTTTWYNLASDVLGIISVSQPAASGGRVVVYGAGSSPWDNNLPTATVASGIGMTFPNGWDNTVNTIQVDYAAEITAATSTSNYTDLTDVHLIEAITLLAAARLVASSEAYRVTQEDIGMGDSSVTPASRLRAGQYLEQMGRNMLRRCQVELMTEIPIRGNDNANPYQEGRLWSGMYYSTPPWGG